MDFVLDQFDTEYYLDDHNENDATDVSTQSTQSQSYRFMTGLQMMRGLGSLENRLDQVRNQINALSILII